MLSARIRLIASNGNDVNSPVSEEDFQLTPFASKHLLFNEFTRGLTRQIWIGETEDPLANGRDLVDIDRYCYHLGCEGVAIRVTTQGTSRVVDIARTADGSTPLYVLEDSGVLRISWDFEEIAKGAMEPAPDLEGCLLYLAHGPSLSRRQIISGVSMLWPGERLRADSNLVSFFEQPEREIVVPTYLANAAYASEEFLRLTAEHLSRCVERSTGVMLEVSGGLDSSCTAVAAKRLSDDLSSYGLIHSGAAGAQQRIRRAELVAALSLQDHEFPSDLHPPIAALSSAECLLTPYDDNHRLSCGTAIDTHPRGSFDLVVTGVGGDELFMDQTYVRREWEVRGSISFSSVLASVARADMFLRRGIWPKNPFASHALVDFCRRLPSAIRRERLLETLTLARAGLSDGFLFPRYVEHYGHVLVHEASLLDFDALIGDSILASFGVAEVHALLAEAREALTWGFSSELANRLWRLIKVERLLKRYCL